MAGEAIMLGVPAIYAASDRRCYTDFLASQQLLWKVQQVNETSLRDALQAVHALAPAQWQRRIAQYQQSCPNLATYIVTAVLERGAKGQ